jgi:ribosome-binding factor A
MSQRMRKINELIREEASKAIEECISRDNLVTVKAIETGRDLKDAIIWVSVMGDEEKAMAELQEHKSEIQHKITSKMYTKYTPKIDFKIDHSQAYVDRIDELLNGKE